MRGAPRILKVLAVGAAAMPFAFGLIRAVQTGSDVRYVWVAVAAMFGGVVATAVARASGRHFGVPAVCLAVFVISMALAVTAGMLLGTRLGPGLLIVAAAFAACFAAASSLSLLARG